MNDELIHDVARATRTLLLDELSRLIPAQTLVQCDQVVYLAIEGSLRYFAMESESKSLESRPR